MLLYIKMQWYLLKELSNLTKQIDPLENFKTNLYDDDTQLYVSRH